MVLIWVITNLSIFVVSQKKMMNNFSYFVILQRKGADKNCNCNESKKTWVDCKPETNPSSGYKRDDLFWRNQGDLSDS